MNGYYQKRLPKLLRSFRKDAELVRKFLVELPDKDLPGAIIDQATAEYKALIPKIPFIGGGANLMTKDLLESVRLLAFYRAMKSNGFANGDSFRIIYRTLEYKLQRIPAFIRKNLGRLQMTAFFKRRLVLLSERNSRKVYPGNFAFKIVTGDGQNFDWGIEFSQCAILSFFRTQNAEEFMPYICPNDYLFSKHFGLGLCRTMTLAEGFPRCDQYLKRGRETQVKLPADMAQ